MTESNKEEKWRIVLGTTGYWAESRIGKNRWFKKSPIYQHQTSAYAFIGRTVAETQAKKLPVIEY